MKHRILSVASPIFLTLVVVGSAQLWAGTEGSSQSVLYSEIHEPCGTI